MAETFAPLQFKRDWRKNDTADNGGFLTNEYDEKIVREDMQYLHEETKGYINDILLPVVQRLSDTQEVSFAAMPRVGENGNWWLWNDEKQAYVDSNVKVFADIEGTKNLLEHLRELSQEEASKITLESLEAYHRTDVLSANTKAQFGLGDEGKPTEVFDKLHRPVGTVELSMSGSPGANWLPCDGSCFDKSEYDELYDAMSFRYSDPYVKIPFVKSGDIVFGVSYGGGWWVVAARSSANLPCVYYSNNLRDWSRKELEFPADWSNQSVSNLNSDIAVIRYLNGQFVVVYVSKYYSSNTSTNTSAAGYIFHATDPSQDWGFGLVCTSGFSQYVNDVLYCQEPGETEGTYLIVDSQNSWYKKGNLVDWDKDNNTTHNTWTKVAWGTKSGNTVRHLNGEYVLITSSNIHRYAYAASPEGETLAWATAIAGAKVTSPAPYRVTYHDGVYYVLGSTAVYYGKSLDKLECLYELPSCTIQTYGRRQVFEVVNRTLVFNCYSSSLGSAFISIDLDGTGTTATNSVASSYNYSADGVFVSDGMVILITGNTGPIYANCKEFLPLIAVDKARGFIKAKE